MRYEPTILWVNMNGVIRKYYVERQNKIKKVNDKRCEFNTWTKTFTITISFKKNVFNIHWKLHMNK